MRISSRYYIVFGLLLALLLISAHYSPIWYDDAGHFLVAREAASGHGICYPLDSEGTCDANSAFITMGPVLTWPVAAWMAALGKKMWVARMLMVLLTMGVGLIFWRMAKLLGNADKGLIAVGILGLNIQFLTYGAEVLGEVPMMGFVLLGGFFLLKWQADGKLWQAGLGILAWLLAVGIKEYAILPLSLALFLWWIFGLLAKKGKAWNLFLLGLVWAFALFIWMLALHKGLSGYLDYLQMRQSYGSEFLAFEWANSLKFLALKPLFWLGTAAILLKLKIKRRKEELLMLALQLGWLVFFLLSAGYDRFGFLLLFIPAIYLAEFAPYLWKEAGRMPKWKILKHTGLILLGLVIFSQQTFPKFAQRMLQPETINAAEKEMASQLKLLPKGKVMLFDQQLVPFLDTSVDWELVAFVPSFAIDLDNLDFSMPQMPNAYDMLVAGPYAFTEYDKWIEWEAIKPIYNGKMAEKWIIFGRKTARP